MKTPVIVLGFALLAASAPAEERFYADLGVGSADIASVLRGNFAYFIDDKGEAPSVRLGYLAATFVGFELGYQEISALEGEGAGCRVDSPFCPAIVVPVRASVETLTAYVVPRWEVGRFTVFGKLGYAETTTGLSTDSGDRLDPTSRSLGSLNFAAFAWGTGTRLQLSDRVDLVADYEAFDPGIDIVSLRAGWWF